MVVDYLSMSSVKFAMPDFLFTDPIGAYDLLIAGQALRHQLTLVTANVSEFSRVKGLAWQDWARP